MPANYYDEEEFASKFDGKIFLRILGLARPHWRWVAAFLTLIMFVSMIDAYFTYLTKRILDEGIVPGNVKVLVSILGQYGALIVIQASMVFGFIYLVSILGERVRYDLRKTMFNHLQQLSLSYYSRTPVGWIMSRVTSDSERVSDLITWGSLDTTWAVMNVSTSMIFMLIINWKLALIVLASIPILLYVAIQFRRRILAQYRLVRRTNSKITGAYNENITGVRVVKALGREPENILEFSHLTSDMYKASYRAAWLQRAFPAIRPVDCGFRAGRDRLVWWFSGHGGDDHHRRHPGLRILCDLYDVADSGSGAHFCRNAARYCVR